MTADVISMKDKLTEEEKAVRARMTALARTFPSTGYCRRGIEPWNALELDAWGNRPRSHGERVTA
jgi:hypothetical protein